MLKEVKMSYLLVFIGLQFPELCFDYTDKEISKEKLINTKWRIVKMDGDKVPDDFIDLEFTLNKDGTVEGTNLPMELSKDKSNYSSSDQYMNTKVTYTEKKNSNHWFTENSILNIDSAFSYRQTIDARRPDYFYICQSQKADLCKIQVYLTRNVGEKHNGSMTFYSEYLGGSVNSDDKDFKFSGINDLSFQIIEKRRPKKPLANQAEVDEYRRIKPIDIVVEKIQ